MRRLPLRIFALASIAAFLMLSFAAPALADGGLGGTPCVRTYVAGEGEGTYVYTSTNGALGVGVETDAVGTGAGVFVIVQPSNCTGGSGLGGGGVAGADPISLLRTAGRFSLP